MLNTKEEYDSAYARRIVLNAIVNKSIDNLMELEQLDDLIEHFERRREALLGKLEIIKSGYGGCKPGTLEIVDRRTNPDAIPLQENPMFNTPPPKKL